MKAFLKVILLKPLFNILVLLTLIIPGNSLGWAIVLMTILIRLALLPSTNSATRMQKKMKIIQPEMHKIKEEFKNDPTIQRQKTMDLYKKHQINPVGSCLPMLVQLPIMFIMYYVFREIGTAGHRYELLYSFVKAPANLNMIFFGINLAEVEKWYLPITSGALQLASSWQMKPKKEAGKEMDMATSLTYQMIFIFPIMTIMVGRALPAALPLYWAVSTAFTVVQQRIILKNTGKDKVVGVAEKKVDPNLLEKSRSRGGVELTVRKKGRS